MNSFPFHSHFPRVPGIFLLCMVLAPLAHGSIPVDKRAEVLSLQFFTGVGGGLASGAAAGLTVGFLTAALAGCPGKSEAGGDDMVCGLVAGFSGAIAAGAGLWAGSALGAYFPGRWQGGEGSLGAAFLGSGAGLGAAAILSGALGMNPLTIISVLTFPTLGAMAFYRMTDHPAVAVGISPESFGKEAASSRRASWRTDLRFTVARF